MSRHDWSKDSVKIELIQHLLTNTIEERLLGWKMVKLQQKYKEHISYQLRN